MHAALPSVALSQVAGNAPAVFDRDAASRLRKALGGGYAALPESARRLIDGVGGSSPYLSHLLSRSADRLDALFATPVDAQLRAVVDRADAAGDLPPSEAMPTLRRAKADVALLAGLCECAGAWDSLQAGAALSEFAGAAVGAALRSSLRFGGAKGFLRADEARCEAQSGVAVIAMGKLGGRELNFSSDIDLVVLFDPESSAFADANAARETAVMAARSLVRILNDQTPEGYVFRTDLRLRPDPGVSAAAISVRAAEAYYEAHGQNWERAAYIRARPLAGDLDVGEQFLKSLRPFIWRRYLDFAAIEDIHSIKRQIFAAKGGSVLDFRGHDVKIGRGGIREIEFLVQTQQLILGGKQPALRGRATLSALAALKEAGRIDAAAAAELEEAYRYLRRVEHRLQMIADEQTHRIPKDDAGVARLAAFLGEEGPGAFERKLREALQVVHGRFADLFQREERLSAGAGSLVFTGVENDAGTLATLEKMGFRRAGDVSETIRRWHAGSLRATRSRRARELLTKLAPRLLEALAQSGDPDAAFVAFDGFLSRLPGGVQVFSLFANNPEVFDKLIRVMTISPFLGREMSRRAHLLESLLDRSWPGTFPEKNALVRDLHRRMAHFDLHEERLDEARRWGAEHRFDCAAQIATGLISQAEAARRFTSVADAAVAALAPIARMENERQHGAVEGSLAIVGLGRLGGGAMTATSDVDLVFVYDAPEEARAGGAKALDAATWHVRFVRRLLTALSATTAEGALYEVDMQLRPSGNKGPWAVGISAFERYYEKDAWTWEEMALLKFRVVAGDRPLGARIEEAARSVIERPRDKGKLAADVHAMRLRLAESKSAATPWDLKRVAGGLIDLEFIVQYLALLTANAAGAPPPDTHGMLSHLQNHGALGKRDAEGLAAANELFETTVQIARAATGHDFSPSEAGLALNARMAQALGARSIEDAEKALVDRQGFVLEAYRRIVAAAAGAAP